MSGPKNESAIEATGERDFPRTISRQGATGVHPSVPLIIVLLSLGVFSVLLSLSCVGLRGSDQYWYTAEVEQLLAGKGNISHVAFPYHAWNGLIPPPFNHHTLIHYLVLLLARFTNAYLGWVILNALATLLTAIFVTVLVKKASSALAASVAFALTLLLPLSFWVTAQPYLESSLAMFTAAGVLLYVTAKESLFKWVVLLGIFVAAYLCRISFLSLLILVPLGYVVHARPRGLKKLVPAGLMLVAVGGTALLHPVLFKPDPALTLPRYLSAKVPGVSDNMHVLYALEDEPVEIWKLWRKSYPGIVSQFVSETPGVQLFYLPFNVAMFLCLILCLRPRGPTGYKLCAAILIVLGMHAVTACLRGNEFRFLHVIQPVLLGGAVVAVAQLERLASKRTMLGGAVVVLLIAIGIDVLLAHRMRREAVEEATICAEVRTLLSEVVPEQDSVILGVEPASTSNLMLSYVLRPRLVLFVRSDYNYTDEQIEKMRANIDGAWLIAREDSPLLGQLSVLGDNPVVSNFPAPFQDRTLRRIGERK